MKAPSKSKDLKLSQYASGYADDLRQDYLALTDGKAREQYPELFDVEAGDLTWTQLYFLEAAILQVQPAADLGRIAWRWRLRFRNVAGAAAYQAYLDSKPPDPSTSTPEEIRADLSSLAAELHYRYLLAPAREAARGKLNLLTFIAVTAFLAVVVVLVFLYWRNNGIINVPALAVVIFFGAVGGLISVQQRLQALPEDDPLFGLLAISSSRFSVFFSPLVGAIFAIILYLFFIGHLLSGSLFPDISTPAATTSVVPFNVFAAQTGPIGGADWAKLVIWCFIAGFGERLVPDILNRLIMRSQTVDSNARGVATEMSTGCASDERA